MSAETTARGPRLPRLRAVPALIAVALTGGCSTSAPGSWPDVAFGLGMVAVLGIFAGVVAARSKP